MSMNRIQAQHRALELNRALPEGADHRWIVHHLGTGEWEVARVSAAGMRVLPGTRRPRALRGAAPIVPADPRPMTTRLIPPAGPPGLS
jgi:hypothetical protein